MFTIIIIFLVFYVLISFTDQWQCGFTSEYRDTVFTSEYRETVFISEYRDTVFTSGHDYHRRFEQMLELSQLSSFIHFSMSVLIYETCVW